MESEKLKKWALLAEILGGMAVIVTLGFVAFEINQSTKQAELNTNALEISAFQSLVNSVSEINSELVSDRDLMQLVIDSRAGPEQLTENDRTRAMLFFTNLLRHGDMAYFHYERGTISEYQLQSVLGVVRGIITNNQTGLDRLEAFRNATLLNPDYMEYLVNFMEE